MCDETKTGYCKFCKNNEVKFIFLKDKNAFLCSNCGMISIGFIKFKKKEVYPYAY